MSIIRAIGYRLLLAVLFVYALSFTVRSDELGAFHAAVGEAAEQHRVAMETLETRGQAETAAAVHRLRESWQTIGERFGKNPPPVFAGDEEYAGTFMQVDMRLIGVLLIIDLGNRDAAREGLASVKDVLARWSARSAPAAR
jgi:hypothetical protein